MLDFTFLFSLALSVRIEPVQIFVSVCTKSIANYRMKQVIIANGSKSYV